MIMGKSVRGVAGLLALTLFALCFGESMLLVLIAYKVHTTGNFHGMPFQFRRSVYEAAGSLAAAVALFWTGAHFIRRANSR